MSGFLSFAARVVLDLHAERNRERFRDMATRSLFVASGSHQRTSQGYANSNNLVVWRS